MVEIMAFLAFHQLVPRENGHLSGRIEIVSNNLKKKFMNNENLIFSFETSKTRP